MRAKFHQRISGEWFTIPNRSIHRVRCCDCSLVHDLSFRIKGWKLQMRACLNGRSTAASRRAKVKAAK